MRRMPLRLLLPAGLVLALGVPPSPARGDAIDDALVVARKHVVSHLLSTVEWARGKKISGYRHEIYRLVLQFEPDNFHARQALHYKRHSHDEPWVQDPSYEKPPDWDEARLQEAKERVRADLKSYRDEVLDALDAHPEIASGHRDTLLDELVDLLPDDPTLRKLRGDVQDPQGHWVLPETLQGRKVRAARQAIVEAAMKAAADTVHPYTKTSTLGLSVALTAGPRTVFGLVDASIARASLLDMAAGDAVMNDLLGRDVRLAGPSSSYLFDNRKDAMEFAQGKKVGEKVLATLRHVAGGWIGQGQSIAYYGDANLLEVDGLRRLINARLLRRFPGQVRGWISEGVGQRLTFFISGKRGPNFVNLVGTDNERQQSEEVMPKDPRDWARKAADLLADKGDRRLAEALTMRLNAMKPSSVLVSYGLAAYLLEGRPDRFVPFLEASVKRHDVDAMVRDVLGADLDTVARRIRRWLLELD
jgi:hypothetical protein